MSTLSKKLKKTSKVQRFFYHLTLITYLLCFGYFIYGILQLGRIETLIRIIIIAFFAIWFFIYLLSGLISILSKKKKTFGGQLSEVEWDAGATYGRYRAGRIQGSWEEKKPCSWCLGTGKKETKDVIWTCSYCEGSGKLRTKIRCERCRFCNWRGYQWSQPYECTSCGGVGHRYSYGTKKCYLCDGHGYRWFEVDDTRAVVTNLIRDSIGRR